MSTLDKTNIGKLTANPIIDHPKTNTGALIISVRFLPNFCSSGPATRLPMKAPNGGIAAYKKKINKT